MSVRIGNDAVEEMVKLLATADLANFGGQVFYYEKKENYSGEYIVVNHLPFLRRDAVEVGIVNVNVHVPRLITNEPPSKRLSQLVKQIILMFPPEGLYLGRAYFEFYGDSRPIEENDGTYFVNVQFKVTYNNLIY